MSIILGIAFWLTEPPLRPEWFSVFRDMAIGVGILGAGFLLIVLICLLNLRKIKPLQGPEEFDNDAGITVEPLDPSGMVKIRGEIWRASSISGEVIPAGTRIKVVQRDNIELLVEKDKRLKADPAGK